jgi:hypothetical protein
MHTIIRRPENARKSNGKTRLDILLKLFTIKGFSVILGTSEINVIG